MSVPMASMHAPAHRLHGDPFPIPMVMQEPPLIQAPRYLKQRWHFRKCRNTQMNHSLRVLNDLAAATVQSGLSHFRCRQSRPTVAQQRIIDHVGRCVSWYGIEPRDCADSEALKGLLKARSFYEEIPQHLAQFDPTKLRILRSGDVEPQDALSILPPLPGGFLLGDR